VVAGLLVLAIVVTLGGSGHPQDSAGAFVLQSRASLMHDRWVQMVADGVPAGDLAEMESAWDHAQQHRLLGIALICWWPGMKAVLDRWDAQTDTVWRRNVEVARTDAMIAERNLHRALGREPAAQLKARLEAQAAATTPGQFLALRDDWELQARLVPVDRYVAAAVGTLAALVEHAKALGITSTPAPEILARAGAFASLDDPHRLGLSGQLINDLAGVESDLSARVATAKLTKQAFQRLNDEIAAAGLYGVNTSAYQARINADLRSFASATTVGQLSAVTKDLDAIVAALKHDVAVVVSQIHVIGGVAMYYQVHSLSCEEASVSMALTHQGIYVSQDQILAEMGADRRTMYRDANGVVRWGDPYVSFVGSVDGSESNYTGYGANYPPLVRVALAHHARILAYGYMSAQTIYARLAAGHPVVVWATWDWAWHPRHDYLAFDGRWVPWIGPTYASHVYTAVGVKPDAVLVNDPLRGQYWVGKAAFQAAYSDFMEAIVFA
jgi:uncharacterized protein YvpB